jgi:hypothetical protein
MVPYTAMHFSGGAIPAPARRKVKRIQLLEISILKPSFDLEYICNFLLKCVIHRNLDRKHKSISKRALKK